MPGRWPIRESRPETAPNSRDAFARLGRKDFSLSGLVAVCRSFVIELRKSRQTEVCPTKTNLPIWGNENCRHMYLTDTNCAKYTRPWRERPDGYAMIFSSASFRARYSYICCGGWRGIPMMGADRLGFSRRAMLFLLVLIGAPSAVWSASLEESAKEFARKIVAALPGRESVSCEIRNISSLRPDEFGRVEQAIRAELQGQGVCVSATSGATIGIAVTLSENWKEFVWTAEIRQGEVSHTVLLGVSHGSEARPATNAMHFTVRSEKFWDGPERILDAAEVAGIGGRLWIVLLLRDRLLILEPSGRLEIPFAPDPGRDPVGELGFGQNTNTIPFSLSSRVCTADLDMRRLVECLPKDMSGGPTASPYPMPMDLTPAGSPAPGKGIGLVISPVCGGTNQFLMTSARDYTQTDSLQVFQTEPSGPVAMSAELDFPGPIVALHTAPDAPRAIVRNVTTGNYEAYRLAISCGE